MENKGFTLIELLAVIIVLGLIMAIAVPSTINVLEKNKKEAYLVDAKEILRIVEKEDKKTNYANEYFVINNKNASFPSLLKTINIKVSDITLSPYDKEYTTIVVRACVTPEKYGSIRYFRIYMSDGSNQLRSVKNLPNSLLKEDIISYNKDDEPINMNDSSSSRYKMVEKVKGNVNNYITCYNFK